MGEAKAVECMNIQSIDNHVSNKSLNNVGKTIKTKQIQCELALHNVELEEETFLFRRTRAHILCFMLPRRVRAQHNNKTTT